jgi:hypothetical protein
VCDVVVEVDSEMSPEDLLEATSGQAQRVLDADEGWPTWSEGMEFQSLAVRASRVLDEIHESRELADKFLMLHLIWLLLTDEMDLPGRESYEYAAAATEHMKRAATEWLSVVNSPDDRAAYLDRWLYKECGFWGEPPFVVRRR